MTSEDHSIMHSKPRKEIEETSLNNSREINDEDDVPISEDEIFLNEASGSILEANSFSSKKNDLSRDIEDSSTSGTSFCLGFEHLNICPKPESFALHITEDTVDNLYTKGSTELQIQNSSPDDHSLCVENEYLEKELVPNKKENIANSFASTPKNLADVQTRNRVISEMTKDARDISDLIVGSHRALNYLLSFYNEWNTLRSQSLSLLGQLREVIHRSCKNSKKVDDIVACINIASRSVENIPHPSVPLAGKIATSIGRIFTYFFASKLSKEDIETRELEIKQTFQKDIDSSSSVYIFGMQCSLQFEETRQAIRSFHLAVESDDFATVKDNEVLWFLNEILNYNPENMTVFYRRLRFCYEKLIRNSKSEESRAFVDTFDEVPEAVEVIDLLPWRFDADCFDNTVVNGAWKELFDAFCRPEPFDIKIFLRKIENCLFFLNKEQSILERAVIGLLIKKV